MKKSKKLIGVVLSVALVISVLATVLIVTASTKETSILVDVDKTELSAGESATVSVSVTSNYPVATMSIPVFYDKTMVDVSEPVATLTDYAVSSAVIDAMCVDTSKIYDNTNVSEEKFGFVLANYIGEAGADVPETINGVVLTFTITAKENVTGNAVVKCIAETGKTTDNIAGMMYFGATVSGTTIDEIPENVENVDITNAEKSVKIENGVPELTAKANTTAVIDNENKYVYGITAGDSVENYVSVENGTLELVPTSSGVTNGTGTIINVKNSSGELVDTYTLIIFGDVNGDGVITASDYTMVLGFVQAADCSDVQRIAADVSGATSPETPKITASDYTTILGYCQAKTPTSNPYA